MFWVISTPIHFYFANPKEGDLNKCQMAIFLYFLYSEANILFLPVGRTKISILGRCCVFPSVLNLSWLPSLDYGEEPLL